MTLRTKITIFCGLLSLAFFNLKSQCTHPSYTLNDVEVHSRYVKFPPNQTFPQGSFPDEYFATNFFVNVFYDPNFIIDDPANGRHDEFLQDLNAATGTWNSANTRMNYTVHPTADIPNVITGAQPHVNGEIRKFEGQSAQPMVNKIGFDGDDPNFSLFNTPIDRSLPDWEKTFQDDINNNGTNAIIAKTFSWRLGVASGSSPPEPQCNNYWWAPALVGFDMLFNPNYHFYSSAAGQQHSGSKFDVDIQTILLHELGHGLGLGHFGASPSVNVMNPIANVGVEVHDLDDLTMYAVNRLYDCDNGIVGTIPCDKFKEGLAASGKRSFPSFSLVVNGGGQSGNKNMTDPCNNCVQDGLEDGVDCGIYVCSPCEQFCTGSGNERHYDAGDIIAANTIVADVITAQNSSGGSEYLEIVNTDGNVFMKAGNHIDFLPGLDIRDGASVTAIIGDCEYKDICDVYAPNIFTANCDGENDWLGFWVNGATRYEVWIISGPGTQNDVYHGTGNVNGNYVRVWDGYTTNAGRSLPAACCLGGFAHVYYAVTFFNDNLGTSLSIADPSDETSYKQLAILAEPEEGCTDSDYSLPFPGRGWINTNKSAMAYRSGSGTSEPEITIAPLALTLTPSPTNGKVKITSTFKHDPELVRVFDSNGKIVLEVRSDANFDLSHLPAGTYFVQAHFDNRQFTEKVVKL